MPISSGPDLPVQRVRPAAARRSAACLPTGCASSKRAGPRDPGGPAPSRRPWRPRSLQSRRLGLPCCGRRRRRLLMRVGDPLGLAARRLASGVSPLLPSLFSDQDFYGLGGSPTRTPVVRVPRSASTSCSARSHWPIFGCSLRLRGPQRQDVAHQLTQAGVPGPVRRDPKRTVQQAVDLFDGVLWVWRPRARTGQPARGRSARPRPRRPAAYRAGRRAETAGSWWCSSEANSGCKRSPPGRLAALKAAP